MNNIQSPGTDDAFKDRVRAEHHELNERLGKLETFIDSLAFDKLQDLERESLRAQAKHMRAYSGVLSERIGRMA